MQEGCMGNHTRTNRPAGQGGRTYAGRCACACIASNHRAAVVDSGRWRQIVASLSGRLFPCSGRFSGLDAAMYPTITVCLPACLSL